MKYPDIDPIALSIFGQINIHWYALTYLAAFFFVLADHESNTRNR